MIRERPLRKCPFTTKTIRRVGEGKGEAGVRPIQRFKLNEGISRDLSSWKKGGGVEVLGRRCSPLKLFRLFFLKFARSF